jgi:hypothetical protein
MTRLVLGLLASALFIAACGDDESAAPASTSTSSSGSTSSSAGGSTSGGGGQGGNTSSSSTSGTAGAGGMVAQDFTVPCAGNNCAPGEVCCFDNVNETQVGCSAPGSCGAGQIELGCDHPDDCLGGTCCSEFDGMVQTMRCQPDCMANNEYVMCSGPDQSVCPAMTTCSNARAGMGYHYCRP